MKRRLFIKQASALVATSMVYPSFSEERTTSRSTGNNRINVGVIGTGSRGTGLTSIINTIDELSVIASCDNLSFRLKTGISKAEPNSTGYSDYRELLQNKNVDAVIIATPFNTHAKIALDALDAGKHIYCEKTLAKGYSEIISVVSKAQESKKIFQTGHQHHSSRLYKHVVDLINQGQVGKITAFDCQWNRHGNWRKPVPEPKFEKAVNWRMYREFSGGLTAELCSHQIDFVNWVLKATPEQVIGVGGIDYWKDGRETYDNVHLIYSYPNGVKAKFTSLTSNAKDGYQIKVIGDKGTIIIDKANAWFHPEGYSNKVIGDVDGVTGATESWESKKGYPLDIQHLDPTRQALLDFKDAILINKNPESNVITGARAALCVQMGLDAMDNNIPVSWQSDWGV
jgi:predicted dehydrogenase